MASRLILSRSGRIGLAASEVDVSREVRFVEALVISAMVIVLDEGRDLRFAVFLKEVVPRLIPCSFGRFRTSVLGPASIFMYTDQLVI